MDFSHAAAIVRKGCAERAYPAAIVEVGDREHVIWREAFGALTYEPDASPTTEDTLFDLASLTKVLATTALTMSLVSAQRAQRPGGLSLDDRVAYWVREWRGKDRDDVRIRALLSHSSGLTAWLPFYRDYTGRAEFQHAICALPLEYAPGTQSVYSDLGFILLGFILEDAGRASFVEQTQALMSQITARPLLFNPPADQRSKIAPTERDPWRGRVLRGEVHDENAFALGGIAPHAGLFSTAGDLARFAQMLLNGGVYEHHRIVSRETVERFTKRAGIPASSRALGWDTPSEGSSAGSLFSARSFGHTGFTGTSLWIDPERRLFVVLLTNRVHPTRENDAIRKVRPAVADAVVHALAAP
jgi:CubicO group peptidase (beta-lactamase class C family)